MSAALCVSERMVTAFPWGAPQRDFYSRNFDPAADFKEHVTWGRPGHCVTRSGILVNELLSVGIPARVVQVFTSDGQGHNISEVWDDQFGWVLVDPSFGGTIGVDGLPVSALSALSRPGPLQIVGGIPSAAQGSEYYMSGLNKGTVLYPSPWSYLRVEPLSAPWPFLGRYARVGSHSFGFGGAQHALHAGIGVCLVLFLLTLIKVLTPRRWPLRREPRIETKEDHLPVMGVAVSEPSEWASESQK